MPATWRRAVRSTRSAVRWRRTGGRSTPQPDFPLWSGSFLRSNHRRESGEGQFIDLALLRTAMGLIGGQVMSEPVSDAVVVGSKVLESRRRFAEGVDFASVLREYKATASALAATRRPFLAGYMAKGRPVFIGAYTAPMRTAVRRSLSIPDDGSDEPGFDPLGCGRAGAGRGDAAGHHRRGPEPDGRRDRRRLPSGWRAGGAGPASRPRSLMIHRRTSTCSRWRTSSRGRRDSSAVCSRCRRRPSVLPAQRPFLGRHTDEVLQREGLSPDEIAELRRGGVVV